MKVFIQLYKEITLAVDLGSEFVLESLNHPNIVVSYLTQSTYNKEVNWTVVILLATYYYPIIIP